MGKDKACKHTCTQSPLKAPSITLLREGASPSALLRGSVDVFLSIQNPWTKAKTPDPRCSFSVLFINGTKNELS